MSNIRKITRILVLSPLAFLSLANAKVSFELGGEGVGYYQTNDSSNHDFFTQENSQGNLGLQLDMLAHVDNGFSIGIQGTFLGMLGLEDSLFSSARQYAREDVLNAYATSKIYLAKKVHNTSFKVGRQELSQEISPLAFSEDWNVFKNTFDAAVVVNTDMENTTFVAAYITKANGHSNLSGFNDLSAEGNKVDGGLYLLTMQNKSLKDLPITATYYGLKDIGGKDTGSALWLDVKSNHTPVKVALQTAQINPSNALAKTTLLGAKVSGTHEKFGASLAYSMVSDGGLSFQNFGTQGDVAFYTQMVNNQDFIASDADTVVVKGTAKLPVGTLTAGYGMTSDKSSINNDFTELNLVYKFDLLATKMFVGYIQQKTDLKSFDGEDTSNNIRVWSRYTF